MSPAEQAFIKTKNGKEKLEKSKTAGRQFIKQVLNSEKPSLIAIEKGYGTVVGCPPDNNKHLEGHFALQWAEKSGTDTTYIDLEDNIDPLEALTNEQINGLRETAMSDKLKDLSQTNEKICFFTGKEHANKILDLLSKSKVDVKMTLSKCSGDLRTFDQ